MFGLKEPISDLRAGSLGAAHAKRDELVRNLQRGSADELPTAQERLDTLTQEYATARARHLIGEVDAKEVSKLEKAKLVAADRVAQVESSNESLRTAIAMLDEQLPDVDRRERERQIRDEIQPQLAAIVKEMAEHFIPLAALHRKAWRLFRGAGGIVEKYPENFLTRPELARDKPVGVYVTSGPRVIDPTWSDLLLPEGDSELGSPLSRWFERMRAAGYDI